ncbi:epoxide hydrolase family protein [Streptomyces prunicolor]|uniref:epoxide hydrolase family protein n=1 Tax=Streptomyces prunicolor TaxID=67348 RepID=UPI00371829AB
MGDNSSGSRSPERFTIDVGQDDLAARLRATRFFDDLDNEDEYYGLSTAYLKPLVEYWADGFDWRAAEKRLNGYDQYKVEIDGTPVHFVRKPGKGPNPTPLLILHGWPWPGEFSYPLIDPLADPAAHGGDPADAFDVIVLTLPGFAWSTPVTRGDLNYWKIADILHSPIGDVYPPGVSTVEDRIAAFESGPTRAMFNAVNVNAHHGGGHFGHYENPGAYVGDVRETFRRVR